MLVAFGLISTYLELALKYLHVVQMGMVQLLCGTVPLVSKQWGHCDKAGAFNFPIGFNNILAAYASWSTSAKGYRTYAINICEVTNAGASVKCDNSSIGVDSVAWLALGD